MIAGFPTATVATEALVLALFHSLWQVAALGLAAWCLLFIGRPKSAQARYAVLCGTLATMAVCPPVTFLVLLETAPHATAGPPQVVSTASQVQGEVAPQRAHSVSERSLSLLRVEPWISQHAVWLAGAWLTGAGLFAARLLVAFAGLSAIKRRRRIMPVELQPSVERMLRHFAFRRQPQLYVVDDLSQALASGWLKPLVLLPASWLTELPPDVLEVVIAHELAHLRRWDLVVNSLQRGVECVLFFHPAVWWCSRQIRIEREICCDALAVGATGGRVQYAKALAQLAARRSVPGIPLFAAGIGDSKMVLLERIRQFLNMPAAPGRLYGPCCAAAGACCASIFWLGLVAVLRAAPAENPFPTTIAPGPTAIAPPPAFEPRIRRAILAEQSRMAASLPAPREGKLVSLPAYTVEPPDILWIEVDRIEPKRPYRLQAGDKLILGMRRSPGDNASFDQYSVNSLGKLDSPHLDFIEMGQPTIAGLTEAEAVAAIQEALRQRLPNPVVTVKLAKWAGRQPITGEHLVAPDGRVNLGKYGQVYVAGMTLPEARDAVQTHLAELLESPEVTLDVHAYNSKVYYVMVEGAGLGDSVQRFPITGNETVLDAVCQIKGLSQVSKKRIWIARPQPGQKVDAVLPVNWQDITAGAATATNYQVLPGDRIFITGEK